MEQTKKRPYDKHKAGNVTGVVWKNTNKDGGTFFKYELDKHIYDKETREHSTSKTFNEADLPDLLAVVLKLNVIYRVKQENGEKGAVPRPAPAFNPNSRYFCRYCEVNKVPYAGEICNSCNDKANYVASGWY